MSIKDLQKLKKTEIRTSAEEYVPYLLVGCDLWSARAAQQLMQTHGEGQVKVVCERTFGPEDLEPIGPDGLRGEGTTPLFYKDQEFRKFGGRSKPQVLLPGEEFFIQASSFQAERSAISALGPISLEQVNARVHRGVVSKVEARTPSDMLAPAHWSVLLTSGQRFTCRELVWGMSPKSLLDKMADKSSLPIPFIQYVDSTHAPAALFVRYTLKKKIDERTETFFIPLSMTYEQGHFIGQFKEGENPHDQRLEFVYFLDTEQVDEENLSKNVRHLRKNVEKIFPDFEKNLREEYIRLCENWACQKIDDASYNEANAQVPHLHFLGANAPVAEEKSAQANFEDSKIALTHTARAIRSLQDLSKI